VVGKVGTVVMVVKQTRVCMWQDFYYYEHGWSPIRELVAAGRTYYQTRSATGNSQRARQTHIGLLYITLLINIKLFLELRNRKKYWSVNQ